MFFSLFVTILINLAIEITLLAVRYYYMQEVVEITNLHFPLLITIFFLFFIRILIFFRVTQLLGIYDSFLKDSTSFEKYLLKISFISIIITIYMDCLNFLILRELIELIIKMWKEGKE